MAGWLVLNADASKPDGSDDAAIGVILRQKPRPNAPLRVVAYISKVVGHMETEEAEYHALIEGLRLAMQHDFDDLQVFTDSANVADQIRHKPPRKEYMKPKHAEVTQLLAEIGERIGDDRVRISWLPRELNREADQRASDAFFGTDGNGWFGPGSSSIFE